MFFDLISLCKYDFFCDVEIVKDTFLRHIFGFLNRKKLIVSNNSANLLYFSTDN